MQERQKKGKERLIKKPSLQCITFIPLLKKNFIFYIYELNKYQC